MTVDLLGPFGGLLALAFGGGWVGGYGFAAKTVLKIANSRIDELKADMTAAEERHEREVRAERVRCDKMMADLTQRVRELEDRNWRGKRVIGHKKDESDGNGSD